MVNYIDPDTYPVNQNSQTGQDPKIRGYPIQWQKPHWHGDDTYNPHLRVLMSEPDGTREYYDPVTGTHSYEHWSGHHRAMVTDGVVENTPGKMVHYIGGGGYSRTIDGHADERFGAHTRQNYEGDSYMNAKGAQHYFNQQGRYEITMGNATQEHYGNAKTRIMTDGKAWSVGVGKGDGTVHDSGIHLTKTRMYQRTTQNGDIWHDAAGSNGNINNQANMDFNSQAGQHTSQKSGSYHVIQAPDIYLTGTVWIQGDLKVSGDVNSTTDHIPVSNAGIYKGPFTGGAASPPDVNNPAAAALDHGTVS